MEKSMLLGVSGRAGAGKDTVADYLVKGYGFKRYAFADAVRDAALAINPILMTNWETSLESDITNPKLNQLRLSDAIHVHGWDKAKRSMPEVRFLLQKIGTEMGRLLLGKNVWVDIVNRKWHHDGCPDAIVTDMRFENEVAWVQHNKGVTLSVVRPDNSYAISSTHASEQYTFECDYRLDNSGTIEQLHNKINLIMDLL